jgi:hypothetical protein
MRLMRINRAKAASLVLALLMSGLWAACGGDDTVSNSAGDAGQEGGKDTGTGGSDTSTGGSETSTGDDSSTGDDTSTGDDSSTSDTSTGDDSGDDGMADTSTGDDGSMADTSTGDDGSMADTSTGDDGGDASMADTSTGDDGGDGSMADTSTGDDGGDSSTADTGAADTSTMDAADAGTTDAQLVGDSQVVTDAGPGGDGAAVSCGAASCNLPSETCCVYDEPNASFLVSCSNGASCPKVTAADAGPLVNIALQCEVAENCPANHVCCLTKYANGSVASHCEAACAGGTLSVQMCSVSASDAGCEVPDGGDAGLATCSSANINSWGLPNGFATCGGVSAP